MSTAIPLILAQTVGESPSPMAIGSVWDFVVKGGPTMIAIGLCSLVALAIIIERMVVLRRRAILPPTLLPRLRSIADQKTGALELCRADGSPLANILAAAIRRRAESRDAMAKAVDEAGRREIVRLRARMRVLGALPQVSTMLGLLGTIFGMIRTFQAIAVTGAALGKTEMLAKGIFEAWTCTAAGLLVAIPVLIAYHALMGWIDRLITDLDVTAEEFVEELHTGVSPTPARIIAEAGAEPLIAPPAAVPAASA